MDESHYLQPKILSPPPFQKKHSKTNGNVGKSPGSVKSPTGSQQFIQGQGQVQGQGQGQSQGQGQAYQQSSQGTTQLRMHSPGPRLSSPTTAPVNMLKPNYEKVQSKIKPWVDELKMRRVQELK